MAIFPNSRRALLAFLHDVAMAALSLVASLYLRIGNEIVDYEPRLTAAYVVGFTVIAAGVFLLTGLYRGIWRYASLPDLFNIARAVSLTVAAFLLVMFVTTRLQALPRSIAFSLSAKPTPAMVRSTPNAFVAPSRSWPSAAARIIVSRGNVAKISAARPAGM